MPKVKKAITRKQPLKNLKPPILIGQQYIFKFKRDTPLRILQEGRKRYARYLIETDPYIIYRKSKLHKKIEATFTPGLWLKTLRDAHGLTQEELAEKLGTASGSRISDWESNRRDVSKSMAKKLSKYFGVSPDRFI